MAERKWFDKTMSSNELTKTLFSIPREEHDSQKENIMKEYRGDSFNGITKIQS